MAIEDRVCSLDNEGERRGSKVLSGFFLCRCAEKKRNREKKKTWL